MKHSAEGMRTWRAPRLPLGVPRLRGLDGRRVRLALVGLVAVALALGGGWLWFRDSPLVAVQHVTVTGESGPDAGAIRSALVAAGRSMSTLDAQTNRLYAAVSAFPVVRTLEVSTQFPHGMRVHVIEELPVAVVMAAGRGVPVAPDGTLLHDMPAPRALPRIELPVPPGGPRLTGSRAVDALAAADAAPAALRPRIALIDTLPAHGLAARLRDGPALYFGDASRLEAKWRAATAVLADPGSSGASYIDVTDPRRPAAGASSGGSASPAPAAITASVPGGG